MNIIIMRTSPVLSLQPKIVYTRWKVILMQTKKGNPMQINQHQLRLECLGYGMKRIAEALDIKRNTVTVKLKDPINRLYLNEFFQICELLGEPIETFIQEGDL